MNKLYLLIVVMTLAVGCREAMDAHDHSHEGENAHSHDAVPAPPHGGTPVVVADDEFHLELVLDSSSGEMMAYVLDGHLESYVPVSEDGFTLSAEVGNEEHLLEFRRVPDGQTGGDPARSSRFEAQGEWLKSVKAFHGGIPSITLNGKAFTGISFDFPEGTMHVH